MAAEEFHFNFKLSQFCSVHCGPLSSHMQQSMAVVAWKLPRSHVTGSVTASGNSTCLRWRGGNFQSHEGTFYPAGSAAVSQRCNGISSSRLMCTGWERVKYYDHSQDTLAVYTHTSIHPPVCATKRHLNRDIWGVAARCSSKPFCWGPRTCRAPEQAALHGIHQL